MCFFKGFLCFFMSCFLCDSFLLAFCVKILVCLVFLG